MLWKEEVIIMKTKINNERKTGTTEENTENSKGAKIG